jgi:hypothetical protein
MSIKGSEHLTGLVRALSQHGWMSDATAKSALARSQSQNIDQIDAILLENITGLDAAAMARFCAEAFLHPFN